MRHTLLTLFLLITISLSASAKEIVIPSVPTSADDFTALRDQLATTPEGGAACAVAALLAFSESPEVGLECLTLILDQSNVGQGSVIKGYAPSSSIMYHVNRISGYHMWPYLGFAYLKNGKAANNYAVNAPFTVVTIRQKNSGSDADGKVKIMVECDGFRPRPVTLRRNEKGIWKAYEMSSLFLNVQPPASSKPTDDL